MENLELSIEDREVISKLNQHFCLSENEKQEEKESIRRLLKQAIKLEHKDLHALGVSRRQVLSLTSRLFLGFKSFIPNDEEMIKNALI